MAGDEVSLQPVPGVSVSQNSDFGTPLDQGLQTGIQLAAHAEQIKSQREKLDQDREELKQKSVAGAFDMLPKLAETKSKAKDMMFELFTRRMEMAGVAVNPAIKDAIGTQDKFAIPLLNAQIRQNPQLLNTPAFMSEAAKHFADPESYMEWEKTFASGLQAELGKTQRTNTTALASTTNAAAAQATKQNIASQTEATKRAALNQGAVLKGNTPMIGADGAFDPNAAAANTQINQNNIKAGITNKSNQTDNTATKNEYDRQYHEGLLNQGQEKIDSYDKRTEAMRRQITDRLGIQQQRLANTADNSVSKSVEKMRDAAGNAQRGEELLNRPEGQIKWADLNETNLDLVNLLQGGKGVIPISRQKALEPPKGIKGRLDGIIGNIVTGVETGGPTQEEINIIKDRLARVKGAVEEFHDTELAKGYKAKTAVGALNAPTAGQLFEMRKIRDQSVYGGANDRTNRKNINPPASPAPAAGGQPAAPAGPKPTFAPNDVQAMLQRGGPVKTKSYLMSKGYSDQEASSLIGGQ